MGRALSKMHSGKSHGAEDFQTLRSDNALNVGSSEDPPAQLTFLV